MKIIHLSDTHVGYQDNKQKLQTILQDITLSHNPNDTIIIHTGDLIETGTSDLMYQGQELLNDLADKDWKILLSPGNHDCGNSYRLNPDMAKQFLSRFQYYIFKDTAKQFPVLTIVNDCAFIGLDTNQAEMGFWEHWFAEGYLGKDQIDALDVMLDSPDLVGKKIILYMHHHPFFDAFAVHPKIGDVGFWGHFVYWNTRRFRRLKDAYPLMQCIRDRVNVLLFGHQHFGYDYSAEGKRYGIKLALDASSSTCTKMDTQRMRYRIIDTETLTVKTHFVKS